VISRFLNSMSSSNPIDFDFIFERGFIFVYIYMFIYMFVGEIDV